LGKVATKGIGTTVAQQFNYYRYTDNAGNFHAVKVSSSAVGATGLGWGAPSAADPPAPKGFHPRVVYFLEPVSQRKRAVPCATPAAFAALRAPGAAAVSLPDDNLLIGLNWNVIGGREERFRNVHLLR
jgi:hypothetical protein